ncbi:MAG TPA: tRNA pseudouridine(38-40) synthase TruA [Flavisolibacter sp.]|nr:tRNA pseudouridine(38-40) synthase TruA [Flavisolibacter sp.]
MQRYFIEVAYKGTHYSGFQIQENANTIQAEIEKVFHTIHRRPVSLTGSSRTDAGVHALQNFFHFDDELPLHSQFVYKANAILPADIVIKNLIPVKKEAHSRFDATSRAYEYRIIRNKNPFLQETALYYPYNIDIDLLQTTAAIIKKKTNFFAFSKTNTQVKNFICTIYRSEWREEGDLLFYNIEGNRFLRGMVRLLTASQLKVGRGKLTLEAFTKLFEGVGKCGFSVPSTGLFLEKVKFPDIINRED